MDKQIVIIKPGSLSPKDKWKLSRAGNIVIEHDKSFEITFKPITEPIEISFILCAYCGERIYLTKERMGILKQNHITFYCSQGHGQSYNK